MFAEVDGDPAAARRLPQRRRPSAGGDPRPAVIQVHGGGWFAGSRYEQGIPLLNHLAQVGWTGFNIDYRLSPEATFPDQIVDVKRAIAWVRENADGAADRPGDDLHHRRLGRRPPDGARRADRERARVPAGLRGRPTPRSPPSSPSTASTTSPTRAASTTPGCVTGCSSRSSSSAATTTTRSCSARPRRASASTPTRRRSWSSTASATRSSRSRDARDFVERLRAVSKRPVRYIELPAAEHAFDLWPSERTARIAEGIGRFLTAIARGASPRTGQRLSGPGRIGDPGPRPAFPGPWACPATSATSGELAGAAVPARRDRPSLRNTWRFRHDVLNLLLECYARHGPIFGIRIVLRLQPRDDRPRGQPLHARHRPRELRLAQRADGRPAAADRRRAADDRRRLPRRLAGDPDAGLPSRPGRGGGGR